MIGFRHPPSFYITFILDRPSNSSYHIAITMSSIQAPSLATSVYPTDFDGALSATSTVKGLPSVYSIATLLRTAEDPIMTTSDSLYPWNAEEGRTE